MRPHLDQPDSPADLPAPAGKIVIQGGLVQVQDFARRAPRRRPASPKPRGPNGAFGARHRSRMLRYGHTLDWDGAMFVTLTHAGALSPAQALGHLRKFVRRFRRQFPGSFGIWCLELQRDGTPHFHLLVAGGAFDQDRIDVMRQDWVRISAGSPAEFHCEPAREPLAVVGYMAKIGGRKSWGKFGVDAVRALPVIEQLLDADQLMEAKVKAYARLGHEVTPVLDGRGVSALFTG